MFLKDSPDCCAENRPQGAKDASGLCQDGSRGGGEKWSGSGCVWRYSQYNFLTVNMQCERQSKVIPPKDFDLETERLKLSLTMM